jgi:hypothetical protein
MLVRYDGRVTLYEKTNGPRADDPLNRMSDQLIVHDQIAIAKILGVAIDEMIYSDSGEVTKYCRDADQLRTCFQNILDDNREQSDALETYAKLFEIAGIPCLNRSSSGYSQGDYAELLIVATPDACKEFGLDAVDPDMLEQQAKLYDAWAWGDVYGYIIERPDVCAGNPDDEDERIWEELDSCWGFYGKDFDWSGLEEAAMSACPALEKVDG